MQKHLNFRQWMGLPRASLVASDDEDGSDSGRQIEASSTVMIYVVGSNLESESSLATKNLQQLCAATSSKNINVLVTTGAAKKSDPNGLITDWNVVRRYVLQDGNLQLVDDLGKQNMLEATTLSDFIIWSGKNYPAKNYRLVMWDHGAGPGGFGTDELFPGLSMTVPTIQQALHEARSKIGIHFDLIGFDACLMASAEVANALAPYADYLAASEELEPGSGWDYTRIFSELAAQPTMSASQFGRVITDSFLAGQKREADQAQAAGALDRGDSFVTFSVMKLDQIANLVAELESFGPQLAAYTQQSTDNWVRVANQRALTSSFGPQDNENQVFDLADLGVFANRLAAENIIPEASRSLSAAVNQAVVYRGNGALASVSSGVSIYFPSLKLDPDFLTTTYAPLDFPQGYKSLLQNYVQYADLQRSLIAIDTSRSRGTILDALLKSTFGVKYAALTRAEPTGLPNVVRVLATQPLSVAANMGSAVTANVTTGWPMLNSHPIALDPLGEETRAVNGVEKPITSYGLTVYVNDIYAQLVFEKDPDTSDVRYVSARELQPDGANQTAIPSNITLMQTDKIMLIHYDYDLVKQEYVKEVLSDTVFAAGMMDITYDDVVKNTNDIRLMVTDFREMSKLSEPIPFQL